MKKIFTLTTMLGALVCSAQTLTQSTHEPQVSDVEYILQLDTSAFTTGLPLGVTGAGSTWDFSAATPATGNTLTNTYDAPNTYTHGTMFSGATIVQNLIGNMYNYIKSSTTPTPQAEIVGMYTASLALTFTNSAVIIQYPAGLGFNLTDAASGTYTVGSFNGPFTGSAQTMADGSGTLQLAGGVTYTNVLRVKSAQHYTLSAGFVTGTLDEVVYNFYDATKKFPIINVSYIRLSTGIGSPTVIAGVFGAAEAFAPVGINEGAMVAAGTQLFPNPACDGLSIQLPAGVAPTSVLICDLAGKTMMTLSGDELPVNGKVDVSTLAPGYYSVVIGTPGGPVNKKLAIVR